MFYGDCRIDKLFVHLDEEFKSNIMIPPPYIVDSDLPRDEVQKYLENHSFKLCWYIDKACRKPTTCNELQNVISNDRREISSLDASGQIDFDDTTFETLLKSSTLHVVSHIHLDNCHLTSIPCLQHFSYLTDLDLSGNLIGKELDKFELVLDQLDSRSILTSINLSQNKLKRVPLGLNKLERLTVVNVCNNEIKSLQSLESSSLKTLLAEGNLFPELDFDPDKLPVLENVSFGSSNCQYINFYILKKAITSKLCFQLKEECYRFILIPPPNILADTPELEKYVNRQKFNLQILNTSDIEHQIESINWLKNQQELPYKQFLFRDEALLCRYLGVSKLMSLISTIGTVTTLDLSGCNLHIIPDLKDIIWLKELVIKGNKIESCTELEHRSIEKVNMEANPMSKCGL